MTFVLRHERVALERDRCCFPCGELLRSLLKQILGIVADNITVLLKNIWASVSSRVQSNGRNPHTGVQHQQICSQRVGERDLIHRSSTSPCTCGRHLLRLEQLDIHPAGISAQADERLTRSVTSAGKINDAACGCALQKIPTSSHHYCGGGRGSGSAAVKPNRFFIPNCESSGEARWILLPRARINPTFKRLPVPTRLHCHSACARDNKHYTKD